MSDRVQGRIAELGREIASFKERRLALENERRELMASEDPAAGLFHASEIHETSREILTVDWEIEYRKTKIRRLELGMDEDENPVAGGGLLS